MGEYLRKLFQKLGPPLADLIGMNAELRSDLGDRLLPLSRFKLHYCLEGRIVCLSHRDHFIPYLLEDMAGRFALQSPVQFLGTTSLPI